MYRSVPCHCTISGMTECRHAAIGTPVAKAGERPLRGEIKVKTTEPRCPFAVLNLIA
jgi:hypothetical protein